MYEQRSYIKYGNGVETNYGYSTNRRRLASLDVVSPKYEGKIMANSYLYDNMDNIVSLVNNVTAKSAGNKTIGGFTSHSYDYDKWGRLYKAEGDFNAGAKKAHYNLAMSYDKLYNVTSKKLDLTQENLQFEGSMSVGHELTYQYDENNPFKLLNVNTKEYATDSTKADTLHRVNLYDFDKNGNQTMASVNLLKDSSCLADTAGQQVRQLLWDEDNRLLSINDNGFVSNYFYDANGERTVKLSQPDMAVFVNGASALKNDSSLMKFVGYVSPYLVVSNGGRYTKHIYAGTQRIASKLGDIEAFGADPRRVEKAGADIREIDFGKKYAQQNDSLSSRYDQLGAMNKPEKNEDYVGGQSFCCGDKPLTDMPQNAGNSENAQFEENIYFYHPDHLGSTSLVTNSYGEITQNISYIPYGEIFVEETAGGWQSPYYFNAKELDEETGLYYYGARYLDPAGARWLSADPMLEKYVGMSPYNYCAGNPVKLVDPSGRELLEVDELTKSSERIKEFNPSCGTEQNNLEDKSSSVKDNPFVSYTKEIPVGENYRNAKDGKGGCTEATLCSVFDMFDIDKNTYHRERLDINRKTPGKPGNVLYVFNRFYHGTELQGERIDIDSKTEIIEAIATMKKNGYVYAACVKLREFENGQLKEILHNVVVTGAKKGNPKYWCNAKGSTQTIFTNDIVELYRFFSKSGENPWHPVSLINIEQSNSIFEWRK